MLAFLSADPTTAIAIVASIALVLLVSIVTFFALPRPSPRRGPSDSTPARAHVRSNTNRNTATDRRTTSFRFYRTRLEFTDPGSSARHFSPVTSSNVV
ncbi:hypothetical protein ACFQMM_11245 [Saliphagus sp. GCM10025308]